MAESNRDIMERYTREFLPTGDAALAEEFVSPDIVMYYPGQPEQRGRGHTSAPRCREP
jgi:hypothetical protein